jgi:DNA-binding response OmpR family regulator
VITILIVDDDESLGDTISVLLEQEGFHAVHAADGRTGFEKALSLKPQLILADLRLPEMSGIDLCKQLRASHVKTPIIVLSAIGEEMDKVLLLEIGADDYIVKPFGTRELLARTRRGEELKFTPAEYNLLTFFLQNPDRALTRDVILNSVWGYESFPNTRTVDAHIVRLRQKLEPDPSIPRHFLTVHGVGYRFIP